MFARFVSPLEDQATNMPPFFVDFVATPNEVFASLRKHFASYRKIKRVTPVVHQNAA